MGKPVIRGTRLTVELVLRKLGEGASVEDMLEAYPRLKEKDIQASLLFAADLLARWSQGRIRARADPGPMDQPFREPPSGS